MPSDYREGWAGGPDFNPQQIRVHHVSRLGKNVLDAPRDQVYFASSKVAGVMLLIYGDESLDEADNRVCAVAGVIGTELQWEELTKSWMDRNGTTPFHAADCESDHGDFKGRLHQENQDLYRDLATLLAQSGLGGFSSVLDLEEQRKRFPPPLAPPLYYQSFVDVLEAMRNAIEDRGDFGELTFDNRVQSNYNATLIYAYLRESNPQWKERLASKLSFDSARDNPRIQVADLFAREAMKDLDNEIGPVKRQPRKSWLALRDTGRFSIKKVSTEYFGSSLMNPETLQKVLGFTSEDYWAWLERNRRSDSYTAYLEFLFWHRNKMTPEQIERLNKDIAGM
jgi:hypothetical protein